MVGILDTLELTIKAAAHLSIQLMSLVQTHHCESCPAVFQCIYPRVGTYSYPDNTPLRQQEHIESTGLLKTEHEFLILLMSPHPDNIN